MVTGALPAGLDRHEIVAEVARVCDRHLPHGATTLIALSGGPDSTALAHLVTEARPDLQVFAAHVRHGLRDDRADARVAAEHAAALGIGYLERAVTVRPEGRGVEAAARQARYTALGHMARQVSAVAILVGHSADDQAETVLLNIVRGSGLRGLSGMAPARRLDAEGGPDRPWLIRPLLRIRRSDVRAFIAGEGLHVALDPTNQDPDQRRARVRADVLPVLTRLSGGSGDPVGALTRLADLARADADALEVVAEDYRERLEQRWGPVRCLRFADLEGLPEGLAARVVRSALAAVRGTREGLGAEAVATLRSLEPGQATHVAGGAWATSGAGWLGIAPAGLSPLPRRDLHIPGTTALPEIGMLLAADTPWQPVAETGTGQLVMPIESVPPLATVRGEAPTISAVPSPSGGVDGSVRSGAAGSSGRHRAGRPPPQPVLRMPPGARGTAGAAWVVLPRDLLDGLAVRARRPGDRLRLAHGTRKLQDLFTDQGVPRAVRDLVPVVVDADDTPVWVPGVAQRHLDPSLPAAGRIWLETQPGQ